MCNLNINRFENVTNFVFSDYTSRYLTTCSTPDYKLRSLWDKIEKAKRSVETILIPMRFTGDDSYAQYSTTLERSAYLSVKASIKPEEDEANGGIVYIGPPEENMRRKRQTVGVSEVSNVLSCL